MKIKQHTPEQTMGQKILKQMKIEIHITKTYVKPAKPVLRWKFISINTYIKKKKLILHLKKLE